MNIKRVGIDLAKQVFQVHGVDYQDKVVLRKQLRRNQLLSYFATLPPCLIGMEACGGAHHWARELQKLGHTVKLIATQFVKPYVKSNKNDANDAEAICAAVGRPTMRFVSVKTIAQQDLQAIHRIRSELVRQRTAKVNQIRGFLAEYGLVVDRQVALCAEPYLSCLKMLKMVSVLISEGYWRICGKTSSGWMNGWQRWTKKFIPSPIVCLLPSVCRVFRGLAQLAPPLFFVRWGIANSSSAGVTWRPGWG